MARKRIIDPEFWLDEEIAKCSPETKLFYIGCWNFSDDYGVIEDSTGKLKVQIFPYNEVNIQPLRDKLIELDKLIPFKKEGKNWLFVKNFLKWQRVDKPSKQRNPEPPLRLLKEYSPSTQPPLHDEVKLSEVKRKEVKEGSKTLLRNWEQVKKQIGNAK